MMIPRCPRSALLGALGLALAVFVLGMSQPQAYQHLVPAGQPVRVTVEGVPRPADMLQLQFDIVATAPNLSNTYVVPLGKVLVVTEWQVIEKNCPSNSFRLTVDGVPMTTFRVNELSGKEVFVPGLPVPEGSTLALGFSSSGAGNCEVGQIKIAVRGYLGNS